ncbi:MarR family transcriptional regulator [Shouchella sp. 1P09AA]|uniref:MarR family winged helix-turn-helix transcriptional regulator n=1 Tax=unclassified Shouchella TaxID=2893065 RepID=UPI0039A117ED
MTNQDDFQIVDAWINYSKFHIRITKAINHVLMEHYHVGLTDFYFLYYLGESPENELQQSELQTLTQLSPSALSRMVSRLKEYKGVTILEKKPLPQDKRGYTIKLTESGKKLLKELITTLETNLNASLSKDDITHIYSLSTD